MRQILTHTVDKEKTSKRADRKKDMLCKRVKILLTANIKRRIKLKRSTSFYEGAVPAAEIYSAVDSAFVVAGVRVEELTLARTGLITLK